MESKKSMTFGEVKRANAEGQLSETARSEIEASIVSVQPLVAQFAAVHAAYKREAEALYQVLGDDARLIEVETYVKAHPPSPGAIAYLVFVARDAVHAGLARENARRRHDGDPKQKAKASVRECWDEWQSRPSRYKGKAAFSRDMLDKFLDEKGMPILESQPVIERWCREWERQT